MSILVDTGILLRAFVPGDPQCALIRESLSRLLREKESLVTTSQNIAEFYNVSTRPFNSRGGYGLPTSVVETRVGFLERLCQVLTESQESHKRWKELINRHGVAGVAVHDARLVAIMLTHNVTRILTLNDQDFRRYKSEGIRIETPQSIVGHGSGDS